MIKDFTDESLKFLTIFGNLAGIAIENATRYTELQKQNDRLKNEADVTHLFSTMIGKSRVMDTRPRDCAASYWILISPCSSPVRAGQEKAYGTGYA